MGTRGLYGLRKNGIDKTTYNHWDSYPEGLGSNVLNFIRNHSIEEINNFYDKIVLVDGNSTPTEEQKINCVENNFVDLSVSTQSEDDWYCLLRMTQGDLETLYQCDTPYMIDNNRYICNSLFCEYAYIINLDTNLLEFYKGFQHFPQAGNRYGIKPNEYGYYPCKLFAVIPLGIIKLAENVDQIISEFMYDDIEPED